MANKSFRYLHPTQAIIAILVALLGVWLIWPSISGSFSNSMRNSSVQNPSLSKEIKEMHNEIKMIKSNLLKLTSTLSGPIQLEESFQEIKDTQSTHDRGTSSSSPIVLILFLFVLFIICYKLGIALYSSYTSRDNDNNTSLTEVISYRLDYYFSTVPFSLPLALITTVIIFICIGALIFYFVRSRNEDLYTFSEALFQTWTFLIDTAAHTEFTTSTERLVGLIMTIIGLVVVGFLIGMIGEVLGTQMEALKRGRSRVIESGHTLILGWSDKLIPIVNEICNANESEGGGTIVVMSQRDKQNMEALITLSNLNFRNSIVVCRNGNPCLVTDLRKVSASNARSIIILADTTGESGSSERSSMLNSADQSDASVLRVIIALVALGNLSGHIVAEYSDIDNKELAILAGKSMVEVIVSHDIIGRIMLQCSRMAGFEGSEFYLQSWPSLTGKTFQEAIFHFPDAILFGISRYHKQYLNPPNDLVIEDNDKLIVIAEDNDTYRPITPDPFQLKRWMEGMTIKNLPEIETLDPVPEKLLFIGWRRDLDDMISELELMVTAGTELWLFSEVPIEQRLRSLDEGGLDINSLKNLTLYHHIGNPVSRRHLERLPIELFDSILILADEKLEGSPTTMDSIAIASLLLIRDIATQRQQNQSPSELSSVSPKRQQIALQETKKNQIKDDIGMPERERLLRRLSSYSSVSRPTVTSEILDSHTKSVLSVANISDFVASNELVSKVVAMVAEQCDVNKILAELLSSEGNETFLYDATYYALSDEKLSFFDIIARSRLRGEIAFGYRDGVTGEIVLNPSDKITLKYWRPDDMIIVFESFILLKVLLGIPQYH